MLGRESVEQTGDWGVLCREDKEWVIFYIYIDIAEVYRAKLKTHLLGPSASSSEGEATLGASWESTTDLLTARKQRKRPSTKKLLKMPLLQAHIVIGGLNCPENCCKGNVASCKQLKVRLWGWQISNVSIREVGQGCCSLGFAAHRLRRTDEKCHHWRHLRLQGMQGSGVQDLEEG